MTPAAELLLVVAAAHDAATARALDAALVGPAALGAGHATALAVCAGRVAGHAVAEAWGEEVAALLTWAEAAPARVRALAAEAAAAVLAGRARPTRPTWQPLGALDRCRAEERAGVRRFGQSDALGRAAVWETVARERHTAGDYAGAHAALERAGAELLVDVPARTSAAADAGRASVTRRAA